MRYEVLKYERIRNLRVDKNLTQNDIAKILNIAQNSYSQYELGERGIPTETLSAIADFHGTSIDYLVGKTDVIEPYPPSSKKSFERQKIK